MAGKADNPTEAYAPPQVECSEPDVPFVREFKMLRANNPLYQVSVSSTFVDLQAECQAVWQAIIKNADASLNSAPGSVQGEPVRPESGWKYEVWPIGRE